MDDESEFHGQPPEHPDDAEPHPTATGRAIGAIILLAILIVGAATGAALYSHRRTVPVTAVEHAVVNIEGIVGDGRTLGTGMILTASGEILTNNHVISGTDQITVEVAVTGAKYRAFVVGTDPDHDVAVLQLRGASLLPTIPLGDSSIVSVGDPVTALGNAFGRGGRPSTAIGNVIATDQTIEATDEHGLNQEILHGMIAFNAPIHPGDSGGPVMNSHGEVIGMATADAVRVHRRPASPLGFAVPINDVLHAEKSIVLRNPQASPPPLPDGALIGVAIGALRLRGPRER